MSADVSYSLVTVYINSRLLAQELSVTIRRDTKAIEVETCALGLAGYSPGAARMMIDVESAVPEAGFEFDPGDYWTDNGTPRPLKLQFFAAGKALETTGWAQNDDLTHGVNARSAQKISFVAQYSQWT